MFNDTFENDLFPFHIFGLTFYSYDQINIYFNNLWIIQIIICLLCCIRRKHYFPSSNLRTDFSIRQIYVYFTTSSFIYLTEMALTNILFTMFDRFMHHLIAIMIFCSVMVEPQVLSVVFLVPFLIHSIYWLITDWYYSDIILFIYNLDILIHLAIMIMKTYNRKVKFYSYRVPLYAALLYNINLLGYLYDYYINFMYLEVEKFIKSFLFSTFISLPFYIYLIYVNHSNENNFKTRVI
jgi:hypothetical protein